MPEEILYVQSRRAIRKKRVQVVQHVFAAILLVTTGLDHRQHNRTLAICEIVAGGLLVGAVIAEKIRHRHMARGHIAWVEFAGSLMIFVEAIEKTRGRHHLLFYILVFVQPLILFMFAVFDARIATRTYLKVDDRGIEVRLRLLFKRRFAWEAIPHFRVRGDRIDVGKRTIKLRDVVDRDGAKEWLVDALRSRGVEELPAQ